MISQRTARMYMSFICAKTLVVISVNLLGKDMHMDKITLHANMPQLPLRQLLVSE